MTDQISVNNDIITTATYCAEDLIATYCSENLIGSHSSFLKKVQLEDDLVIVLEPNDSITGKELKMLIKVLRNIVKVDYPEELL